MVPAPLLSVRDLEVTLRTPRGRARTVDGVGFDLLPGESLGIAGESGSGKSQTALAIAGLLPARSRVRGSVRFDGQELIGLPARRMRRLLGAQIGMVFQDPLSSLNPYLTIGAQMMEVAILHLRTSRADARLRAAEMLERVGIPGAAAALDRHPHEFSGGMRQRIAIAMMLLCRPRLLIADEPTSALDMTIQAQILQLLAELRREMGLALILISHDLATIGELCGRVLVMYGGRVMESGPCDRLLTEPAHPYSRALVGARLRIDSPRGVALQTVAGPPPDPLAPSPGCPFHSRCASAYPTCERARPVSRSSAAGTLSACHLHEPGIEVVPGSETTSKKVGKPL